MKRWISCLLTAAMVFSFAAQCPLITAKAAEPSSSSSDALAALGIDASVAPKGYDPDSLDNPYGRDTIAVTPVYELYTIGWNNSIEDAMSQTLDTGTSSSLQSGTNTANLISNAPNTNNTLQSRLYGNSKWNAKTSADILGAPDPLHSYDGQTIVSADYTIVTNGTFNMDSPTETPTRGYLLGPTDVKTSLKDGTSYAMADVAAGKFHNDKNNPNTLSSQIAMVYAGAYSKNGGLYLRFGDAITGQYGKPITLIPTGKEIGNPTLKLANEDGSASDKLAENFAENPYQLKNYLQVATGDWNGDGIDEVAVYIPEVGNSRIVVYALQKLTGDGPDAYKDPGKWGVAWTYFLREGDVVSNMVSLVSGDVDQDGIDDLACTWGYYYGPEQNVGSRAVVMFGGKDTNLLKRSQEFSLSYGASNIVRASFAFGDLAGSGEETLILCGQSDADLKSGKDSRYVALYTWNGRGFTSSMAQNFVLFETDKDGKYTWSAMGKPYRPEFAKDHFFSLPLTAANTAIISRPIQGDTVKQGSSTTQVHGSLLYFDSLIISCGDKGLSIDEAWDTSSAYPGGSKKDYVEYSAAAGDLTGQNGAGTLFTMSQTLSDHPKRAASYTVTGTHQKPVYTEKYYYKNWFCKLFKIKTWYNVFDHWETVTDTNAVAVNYSGYTPSETYLTAVARSEKVTGDAHYYKKDQVNSSYALCLANTDNDSSYMNYAGKHYFTYTDPQVLAVLASPPYFADLLDRDDLSGNYPESTTSYSSSTGSGGGSTGSTTISVGAYVSYEQDIKIFGVTVASWEAEATITAGFTWETEHTSTLEQTITYSATSGEDKVAFYSIPMEIYEYTSYVPDGKGGYDKVITAVNIPHEASVRLLSLDDYEAIAEDYSVLPAISGSVLTHTLGDPASYPSNTTSSGPKIAEYEGTPASVGFTAAGGGSTISQEIAMSEEKSNAYIGFASIDTKLGAGAGGVKVGVVAGFEGGGGTVKISTSGSSFSGQLQDMPIEAQNYGYAMNWRIFCYQYKQGKVSFPVVSYAVTEVKRPAPLPTDFQQNIAETTEEAITLTWTYDKPVSGFQLYRYYDFPDGSGSYRLKYVPFSTGTKNADGTYTFSYTDKGLSPYTEYLYQIQTESSYDPKVSIYSEPLSCRTKTEVGYPTITVKGLEDGKLPIYPDGKGTATVVVEDPENYKGLSYQWQKLSGSDWKDISGAKGAIYTISDASAADQGTYRCRVNAIYFHEQSQKEFSISAYSDSFTTAYSKRTPSAELTVKGEKPQSGATAVGKLHAQLELHSANVNNFTAPTGYVTFTITGTDYESSRVVDLVPSSNQKDFLIGNDYEKKYYSTASLDLTGLADGAYTVTAYYSGDRVFKDLQHDTGEVAIIGDATGYRLTLAKTEDGSSVTKFTYGEAIYPTLSSVTPTSVGYQPVTENLTYRIVTAGTDGTDPKDILVDSFASGDKVPNVGVYTFQALVDGKVAAKTEITVSPRPVTVSVPSQDNVTANVVEANLPVLKGDGLISEELADLKLTYKAFNSAGNTVTLHNNMDPGNYTVTPCPSDTTPADLYQNYTVTYVSGTYTVIGLTYRLSVEAQDYTDKAGSRAVGTAGISATGTTKNDYSANTVVQLYAQPNDGYMVDHWTVKYGETAERKLSGDTNNPNRLTITTEPAPTEVKVYFKVKPIVLTATTDKGGRVDCTDDENFTSGANVSSGAEFTFKAVPAEGYHFFGWQLGVEGTSTTYPAGTDNGDGTNSLNIKVGTNSIALKAVFQRDSYTLTLEGDITAHYMRQNPADPNGPQIETNIVSGASIPGDTEITARPKTGYQAAEGATFILNGEPTTESDSYTFPLKADSVLSLVTQRNRYAITAAADDDSHGSVSVLVDGQPAQGDALSAVEGGSVITFIAKAERGYHFDRWTVNEADDTESGDTLTVGALGQNMAVTANFAASKEYTASGIVSHDSRGTMLYTLYDIYGNAVDEAESEMPDTLTLYEGESILFKVKANPGYMVEQWDCNGSATVSTAKTYPGGKITADSAAAPNGTIAVKAYLVASSLYEVGYAALDNGDLSAKADGEPFTSMDLVSGGSDLTFTAVPADGYMVDYWTVTQGKLGDAETTDHYQADDLDVVDPVLTLEGLRDHTTVRVRFKEKQTRRVTLNADTGAAAITYVTPLTADDNGVRNSSSEEVRAGGTVKMTLTPESTYLPKGDLKQMISDRANGAQVAVTESGGTYTVTVRSLNSDLSLAMSDLFVKTYSITLPEHVTANVARAAEGDTVKLTVTPASKYALSTLTLSAGTLNETVSSSTLTYTFTMPAEDVTVSASFTYQGGGSSGGGGGGGGGGSVAPTPEVKPGNSTVSNHDGDSIPAAAKISDGTAAVTVDLKKLADIAKDRNGLILDLSKEKGADSAAMDSQLFLALSQGAGRSLTVKLPKGIAALDQATLSALIRSVQDGDTLTITVAPQSHSDLTSAQSTIAPTSAAIAEVTLTVTSSDGTVRVIHDLGGTAEISLPYTLKSGETGERLTVYYLSDTGAAEKIPCTYDAAAKAVTFRTDHFSTFLVVHEYSKPFTDVIMGSWYYDGVNNALANGWFSGVSATAFAPDSSMTRAMLVTVLYRMSGSPTVGGTSAFVDVSSGAWYAQAVAWAAENQLVAGYEDGTFRPDLAITRQQMAAILYRFHSWAGNTPVPGGSLSAYRDAADVAPWALEAMNWANTSGLILGTGPNTLTPNGTATRAQVAVILTGYTKQTQK